jgi:hypothetical protein
MTVIFESAFLNKNRHARGGGHPIFLVLSAVLISRDAFYQQQIFACAFAPAANFDVLIFEDCTALTII